VRAVVFAYHNIGVIGLEALEKTGYEIIAVFTHEDDPAEVLWFPSVRDWTQKHRARAFCPEHLNTPEWIQKISSLTPDVIFSFYYRRLISQEILKIAPSGAFNLHGSLLPAYRGRCPVNWALIKGEEKTGVTLHYMTDKPDAGDIVCQKTVPIDFDDTALTLYNKLYEAAKSVLEEALPMIKKGTAPRIPQDLSSGSYFGGRTPEDGRIDWRRPAVEIYNLIRAVTTPYPGAFTFSPDGRKIIIWRALLEDEMDRQKDPPGTVAIEQEGVFVRAAKGRVKLLDIECMGKRMADHHIFEFFQDRKGIILS